MGRGALQAIGDFTECKALKVNAVRLHGYAKTAHGRLNAGVPAFIGRKLPKRRFQFVLQNAHVLFLAGIGCVRGEAEFPKSQAGQGF